MDRYGIGTYLPLMFIFKYRYSLVSVGLMIHVAYLFCGSGIPDP
jgi:hypothetical protein